MFNHLLLKLPFGFRNIFLKPKGGKNIRRFFDKLDFQVESFFINRLSELFCGLFVVLPVKRLLFSTMEIILELLCVISPFVV